MKNLSDYHELSVQSDTLLQGDIWENFRDTCLNIYNLDHAHFYLAPALTWVAVLKKERN